MIHRIGGQIIGSYTGMFCPENRLIVTEGKLNDSSLFTKGLAPTYLMIG